MRKNAEIAEQLMRLAKALEASEYPTHEYVDLHTNPDGSHVIAMFVRGTDDDASRKYCVHAIEEMGYECETHPCACCLTPKSEMVQLRQYGNGQCGYEVEIAFDDEERLQKFLDAYAVRRPGAGRDELADLARQAKAQWMKGFTVDGSDGDRARASFTVGSDVMEYNFGFTVTRRTDGVFRYMVAGNCIFNGRHGFNDARELKALVKFGVDKMVFG